MPIRLKALKPKETDFEPPTLGEHVRKRRLELRLTQKQVAHRLGVNPWTVLNWEKSHTEPPIQSMGVILRFLGYDPFPPRDWERGGVILYRSHRTLVARLLSLPVGEVDQDMGDRWNRPT